MVEKPVVLSGCAYLSWKIITHIWSFVKVEKEPLRILVTGAAGMLENILYYINTNKYNVEFLLTGQIGYALVPMIASGVMLGPDQPVIIHMLDIEGAAEALNGVKMELIDAAFPLLKGGIN